jgi:hypothetical protein
MQAFAFVSPWLNQVVVRGVITLGLQVWIVILMLQKKLVKRFPLFFFYIFYQIAEGIFRWIFEQKYGVGSRAYYYAYWDTEVGELLLLFLALGESSWHMFRAFRRLRWFWRLLILSLAVTLAYGVFSAWVNPPRRVSPAMAIIIRLDFIATFIPMGVALLYFGLVFRFRSWQWFGRESGIIVGLAVNSLAGLVMIGLRSYFGKAAFGVTSWIGPWGYILAEIIWIKEFLEPDPPELSKEDLAILRPVMEQVSQALDRYSGAAKGVGKGN